MTIAARSTSPHSTPKSAGARLLIVARECGFTEATTAIERDIVEDVLPGVVVLAALADGDVRAAVAERYRRLKQMLG